MTTRRPNAQHAAPAPLRLACRALSLAAPPLAARVAADLFCRPRPRRHRRRELPVLERATRSTLEVRGHRLARYTWGDAHARPLVVLHHGWSADAAQMTGFVDPLLEAGFAVTAWDALGHGESPGRLSSFVDMVADALEIVGEIGPVHAVVGHSMGAMVAARIARAHAVEGVALVAPPAEMRVYSQLFADALGFTPRVHDAMVAWFERSHDIGWEDITAESMAAGRGERCLVVFDADDRDAPPEHARRWIDAWAGPVTEHRTEGLGHRHVLRDAGVHAAVADWSAGDDGAPSS